MKKLIALLIMALFVAACGNEAATNEVATDAAAHEMTAGEEKESAETGAELIETENVETVPLEPIEVKEEIITEPIVEEIEEVVEEPEESDPIQDIGMLTVEEIQGVIQSFIGIDDELVSFEVADGDIYIALDMATGDLFTPEDLAVTRYAQLSDELLYYEGWNNLAVEFLGIGTISMNYSEAETNEYGSYFPVMVIEERLNY